MVAVEEGQLLLAVSGIKRVINIKGHRFRWRVAAAAKDIHHPASNPDQGTLAHAILKSRHRRLAHRPCVFAGHFAGRHHEGRVVSQFVQVITVFITARDGHGPRAKNVTHAMRHPRRIAIIGDYPNQTIPDPRTTLRLSKKQNTGVRGDRTTIKTARNFPGTNGWKREGSPGYITHGGVGSRCPASGIDCTHVLYAESDTYAIAANKKQHRHE